MTRSAVATQPTLMKLFGAFVGISLTSFGGGLSGWMLREFVSRRSWLSEEEFLNALAISQALPGVNVSNMAIWIGFKLFGVTGALVGLAGVVLPGAIAVILIAEAFSVVSHYSLTHIVLIGAAAAAIGLPFALGITAVRRLPRDGVSFLLAAVTFATVGLLHWPILRALVGLGLVSVALAYHRAGRKRA